MTPPTAVINEDLWNRVQEIMLSVANRPRTPGRTGASSARTTDPGAWLTGKLRDETGDRLTPTHTTRKGRRLRYYVSNRLISGGTDPNGWRLPGPALEKTIADAVRSHLQSAMDQHQVKVRPDARTADELHSAVLGVIANLEKGGSASCAHLVASGSLKRKQIELELNVTEIAAALGVPECDLHSGLLQVTAPFDLRRRGVEVKIVAAESMPEPDPHLRAMLIRAHGWVRDMKSGTRLSNIARKENVPGSFIRTRAQLAFLSPKIQTAILDGTQPPELSLKRLVSVTHPSDWAEQERMFGFPT